MIPKRLKLYNFMPYRGEIPELSFDGLHTLCISGDNGNGKSALIDAITWALWGKSRAKNDDDLIYQGERETTVVFDFAVGQTNYRIIRKHALPKTKSTSGQSSLNVFLAADGNMTSLSGETKTQTQQKINEILHMDYETFVNSAYIKQGHADEFTRAIPAKRKEILGRILGIDLYEGLEERASKKERALEVEKAGLETLIESIEEALKKKGEFNIRLKTAEEKLRETDKDLTEKERVLKGLEKEKEVLEKTEMRLGELGRERERLERDTERWQRSIRERSTKIREYEDVLSRKNEILQGSRAYDEAKRTADELDKKLRTLIGLRERKNELEKTIREAQHSLLSAHKLVKDRIEELTSEAEKIPSYQKALRVLQDEEEKLKEREETLEAGKLHLARLVQDLAATAGDENRLKKDLEDLEEKIALLSKGTARCPLCESELGQDGLNLVKEKYRREKEERSSLLRLTKEHLLNQSEETKAAREENNRLEASLKEEHAGLKQKEGGLRELLRRATDAAERVEVEKANLQEVERQLTAKDFARTEQAALNEIDKAIFTLGYDRQEHEKVRQRLEELKPFESEERHLKEAENNIEKERSALTESLEASAEIGKRLDEIGKEISEMSGDPGRTQGLLLKLEQAREECEEAELEHNASKNLAITLKAQLAQLEEQEERKIEKEKELKKIKREAGIYGELARAFGKNGIQAMLIETALPEIENEANRLLAHMTDNRMHLSLDLKRPSKKGDAIETLDINISDELGTRNYEMFSGGEAFRVNFALRIALSRLLARRSGAPLPTIIIDEGFGTQDNTGVEKMKEAIASIEDEFEKIIVITHMEDLKEAFPNCLEVVKSSDGSRLMFA